MKKILMLLVAGLTLSFATQAQKIGHVNMEAIMSQMPEFNTAKVELENYSNTYGKELETLQKELQDKFTTYQNTSRTMTEAMKEVKEKELNSLNQRLQELGQTAQEKVQMKEAELLKPVLEKLKAAIKDLAKEKNYDYILETSAVHFAKDTEDVSTALKAKLGIK